MKHGEMVERNGKVYEFTTYARCDNCAGLAGEACGLHPVDCIGGVFILHAPTPCPACGQPIVTPEPVDTVAGPTADAMVKAIRDLCGSGWHNPGCGSDAPQESTSCDCGMEERYDAAAKAADDYEAAHKPAVDPVGNVAAPIKDILTGFVCGAGRVNAVADATEGSGHE